MAFLSEILLSYFHYITKEPISSIALILISSWFNYCTYTTIAIHFKLKFPAKFSIYTYITLSHIVGFIFQKISWQLSEPKIIIPVISKHIELDYHRIFSTLILNFISTWICILFLCYLYNKQAQLKKIFITSISSQFLLLPFYPIIVPTTVLITYLLGLIGIFITNYI